MVLQENNFANSTENGHDHGNHANPLGRDSLDKVSVNSNDSKILSSGTPNSKKKRDKSFKVHSHHRTVNRRHDDDGEEFLWPDPAKYAKRSLFLFSLSNPVRRLYLHPFVS